ncbi:MAG: SurA N-terminal domain-containing protein [bacterium]
MENEEVKKEGKSKVIPVVIILIILAVVVFVAFKKGKMPSLTTTVPSVATVNGIAIPKSDYDKQMAAAITSYKAQGIDLNADATKLSAVKTQIMDGLINNELLNQAVAAAGIKADPAEVEKQYQAVVTQVGGADKFKAELAKNNLTDAEFRSNITKQLAAQTYLLQNIDIKSITVTDAEVSQFYNDYAKSQKASGSTTTLPALKDVSAQIKQQLTSNKEQTLVMDFIATLKAKAKIEKTI